MADKSCARVDKPNINAGFVSFENLLKNIRNVGLTVNFPLNINVINMTSGKNDEIPVEVNGCIFKGKLEEGNFHINAESLEEKKNNEMIKLHIKSCKFPNGIKSAVNSMNSKILLEDSFDEMSQKSYKKVDKSAQFKFDFIVGLTCIAVVSAIAIYFTTKRNQQIDSENSIEL